MTVKARMAQGIRHALFPVFARYNPGDVTIKNHRTGHPLRLHSFRHKNYWVHGRRREAATMDLFGHLIHSGDRVAEVGGHIGYISQYFADLVGESGEVVVFEPGSNNLAYLTRNTVDLPQVNVIHSGVGAHVGQSTFFIENLSGQNNSFVPDFQGLAINSAAAGVKARVESTTVDIVTLDSHFRDPVNLIKVDVEGFELPVLLGAERILAGDQPLLMVEIMADHHAIGEIANEFDYDVVDEDLRPINLDGTWGGNSFWFHRGRHAKLLEELRA